MVIDTDNMTTQAQFGEMVGIAQQTVSDLIARGVLSEPAPVGRWLRDYCANLREVAAGRQAAGDLDLAFERARLARAQAIRVERENAIKAGEMAPVHVLEEVLTMAAARVSAAFDAIPGQVHRRLPHLPAGEIDFIRAEIAKARNVVAAMTLKDITDPEDDAVDDDLSEQAPEPITTDATEGSSTWPQQT